MLEAIQDSALSQLVVSDRWVITANSKQILETLHFIAFALQIGAVMAIDNVLLLLLVPWSGALSDRASAQGRGRRRIVVAGLEDKRPPWRLLVLVVILLLAMAGAGLYYFA